MSASVSEKSNYFEKKVLFWALLGPVSLLLSLCLGLFNAFPGISFLALTAFLGIFICFKWQQKGLIVALALLLTAGFFTIPFFGPSAEIWQIGLIFALVLGLVVTNYSFIEAGSLFRFLETKHSHHEAKINDLKLKFSQIQTEWETDRNSLFERLLDKQNESMKLRSKIRAIDRDVEVYQTKIKALKEHHRLKIEEISKDNADRAFVDLALNSACEKNKQLQEQVDYLNASFERLKKTIEVLEEENKELSSSLADLSKDSSLLQEVFTEAQEEKNHLQAQFQEEKEALKRCYENDKTLLNEKFEAEKQAWMLQVDEKKMAYVDQIDTKHIIQSEPYKNLSIECRRYEGLYKQLKKQFDEKNTVLEATRKELFLKENALIEMSLNDESCLKDDDFYLNQLQTDCQKLCVENRQLEEENRALEALVESLLNHAK